MRPYFFTFLICMFASSPAMAGGKVDKSGLKPQVLKLPTGPGSIVGLGESFEPQLNSGAATYRVPIALPPGRAGFTPGLALVYNGGKGNSSLGIGWQLSESFIQRQTDKGLPVYNDARDTFVNNQGEELVSLENGTYRCENETTFDLFERFGDGWKVSHKDGSKSYFGLSESARIYDGTNIFKWYISKQIDTNGNEISYNYNEDAAFSGEKAPKDGQVYLTSIVYNQGAQPNQSMRVELNYEQRSSTDSIFDYRSRYPVQTTQRCKEIIVKAGGNRARSYKLLYDAQSFLSRLHRIEMYGKDEAKGPLETTLTFEYTEFELDSIVTPMDTGMNPGVGLDSPNVDIVDMNGDAFPDLIYTGDVHKVYLNNDGRKWIEPYTVPGGFSEIQLSSANTMLMDMNGDGRSDLFLQGGSVDEYQYFAGGQPYNGWDLHPVKIKNSPVFTFGQDTKPVDLDNDGMTDIIWKFKYSNKVACVFNLRGLEMSNEYDVEAPSESAEFNFGTEGNSGLILADMNGDGLQDFVVLNGQGQIWYYPGHGVTIDAETPWEYQGWDNTPRGAWDAGDTSAEGFRMANAPDSSDEPDFTEFDNYRKLKVLDINGDGLSDLVYVADNRLKAWLNMGGSAFSPEPYVVDKNKNIPDIDQTPIRTVDMNANGTIDVVWNRQTGFTDVGYSDVTWIYLDLTKGVRPNLLRSIDNGIGQATTIEYKSSTEYLVSDHNKNREWKYKVPIPVNVVSKISVSDGRNNTYTREMTYHDGYYDGKEKEFRGFEHVEQREVGDATAPDLIMAYTYDTGASTEALKGKPLELKAMDDSNGVFYQENYTWGTHTVAYGANGDTRNVTFPFQTVKTRDISEKGTGTPVQLKWEYGYDDYGNVTRQIEHGRLDGSWDDERLTMGTYTAQFASGQSKWILDQVVESITEDEDGNKVAHKQNYYDDLSLGEISKGNLTKVEDWVSGDDPFVTSVRNKYDDYGNIIAIYDPLYDEEDGHYRQIKYDTTYHTFPVEENIYTGPITLTMSATYDAGWGVMKSSTDYNGYMTTYDYDTFGRLTSMTKPPDSGHTVEYDYKLAQPVGTATVTDTGTGTVKVINWVETRQRDDSPGDGFLRSRTFYDGMGRKIMTRSEGEDADQVVVTDTIQFNARKLPWRKYLPYFDGGSLDFVEPTFNTGFTEHFYDALGREIRVRQPVGPDGIVYAETTYKPLEKIVRDEEQTKSGSIHEGNGMRYVTDGLLDKDGNGRLREVYEIVKLSDKGEPIANPVEWKTTYSYDLLDNLTGYVDSQNNSKSMKYDGLKRKISMEDPDRGQMTYTYDDASNLRETVDAKGQTIRYEYDGVNRLTKEYYGADKTTPDVEYHYDLPGDPVNVGDLWQHSQAKTIADIILNGGVSAEKKQPPVSPFIKGDIHPLPPPAGDIKNQSIYDMNNDGVLDVADVVKAARTFPQSDTVTAANTKGFLSWVRDQSGEEHNSYDTRGRVKWVVKGINIDDQNTTTPQSQKVFNHEGSIKGKEQPPNSPFSKGDIRNQKDVNQEGHEEKLKPQRTQNNNEGQPPNSPFTKGDIHPLPPPAGDRKSPLEMGDQGGCEELPKTHYGEYGTGKYLYSVLAPQVPLSVGQASPLAVYDANRGRLTYLSGFRGVPTTRYFYSSMEYDSMDRITWLVYPDGTFVNYKYNNRGLLESVAGVIDHYNYNPSGQNKELALSCGIITKYDYDHRLRLNKLTTTRSRDGLALQDLKYTYDGVSNITRIDDGRDNGALDTIGGELGIGSAEARKFQATQSFVYDSLYRLTQATNPDVYGTINHRYDRIGNMIKQDAALIDPDPLMNLGMMTSGGAAGTWNREVKKPNEAGPHAITGTEKGPNGALIFTYDDNGNMLNDRGTALNWDYKDRLISLTNGSTTASYTYDYTDTRKRKVVNDAEKGNKGEVLYIDKLCEVREGKLVKYIYAGNNRIARADDSQNASLAIQPSAFYLHDHLGSTNLTITTNATVAEQMVNYPFGHERLAKRANLLAHLADYKFTGKETDGESGLQYFEARYYVGYLGRFVSVDKEYGVSSLKSINSPKYRNLYSYALNNPIILLDPDGNSPIFMMTDGGLGGSKSKQLETKTSELFNRVTIATLGGSINKGPYGTHGQTGYTNVGGLSPNAMNSIRQLNHEFGGIRITGGSAEEGHSSPAHTHAHGEHERGGNAYDFTGKGTSTEDIAQKIVEDPKKYGVKTFFFRVVNADGTKTDYVVLDEKKNTNYHNEQTMQAHRDHAHVETSSTPAPPENLP